jgi:hypothetical protein
MQQFNVYCNNYSTPNCNFGHNRYLNNVMNYDNTEILFTLQNSLLFKNTVYYKETKSEFKKNSDVYSQR